ncbi:MULTISPECIES: hypothetical protein [Glycomyces]|uniref:DUF998 domain-containing protein n=2 Tax=Glycomyces TaxID=58113 RepID=A0A9X3PSW1_9ACTN|nr:hypothetical protein [Glycomyces lechevalierae]MDA1384728.1 hypothetical protein [Glycomyces lechevalierae]MDR7337819.1 hypothetical protein [Glycomyces lechevalierae]
MDSIPLIGGHHPLSLGGHMTALIDPSAGNDLSATGSTPRRAPVAGAAMCAGAIVFAAIGFPGVSAALPQSTDWAGLAGVLLVLAGFRVFGLRHRAELGRLGAWGRGLMTAGLVATAVGFLANAVGPLEPGGAEGVVAIAGVPAWMLSHLVYIGATVLGAACLRKRSGPRPTAVLMIASLPLLVLGVAAGLTSGEPASGYITWAATEGQAGLVWSLIGFRLCRRG